MKSLCGALCRRTRGVYGNRNRRWNIIREGESEVLAFLPNLKVLYLLEVPILAALDARGFSVPHPCTINLGYSNALTDQTMAEDKLGVGELTTPVVVRRRLVFY